MIPQTFTQGLGMIFLGAGAMGSSKLAIFFSEPYLALGYLIGAIVFIFAGVYRVLHAF